MRALIENGLLFGNLERVDAPHMVERYNAALRGLSIEPTGLQSFHIDAAGYSPEVAAERGDESYLDPQGVNRLFVILSPRQRNLPIIRTSFSADLTVYRKFLDANMRAIETLTLHDAVFGEMENLVLSVDTPADVISFNRVRFLVHTPSGLLERGRALEGKVAAFLAAPEAWRDTAAMDSIVEDARACGDVRRNGLVPSRYDFSWPEMYHTTHFGGVYVLRRDGAVTLFADPWKIDPIPGNAKVHDVASAATVLSVLERERLVEDLNPGWLASSGVLDHKVGMAVAAVLLEAKVRFDPAAIFDERTCARLMQVNHAVLKADERFRTLYHLRTLVSNGGDAAGFYATMPAAMKMAVRRALPDLKDVWEVNRLLAEFSRFDPVGLFIVNKPLFYDLYAGMGEEERRFAVHAIKTVYQPDVAELLRHKHAVRERFFGKH